MTRPPRALRTQRLCLRPWRVGDAEVFRDALDRNDAHLRPWIPFMRNEPRSLSATRTMLEQFAADFDDGSVFRYGVFLSGVLIGEVMLIARVGPGALEVGYWLDHAHCGRGFASESVACIVKAGLTLDAVDQIEMHCDVNNHASNAVPRRLGLTLLRASDIGDCVLNIWATEPKRGDG